MELSTTITELDTIDWLKRVDGFTVEDAISYLKTLNQTSVLRVSIVHKASGDKGLSSELENSRELTPEELKHRTVNRLKNLRVLYQNAVDTHNRWVAHLGGTPEGVKPHYTAIKQKLAEIDAELRALE
jgi:hypothetical protein